MKPLNHFMQRIPGGCDTTMDRFELDFETTGELVNCEYVQRFMKEDNVRLMMSDKVLLLTNMNGQTKWALGYVDFPDEVDLPKQTRENKMLTEGQRKELIEEYRKYQSKIDVLATEQNEISEIIKVLHNEQMKVKEKLERDLHKLLND